MAVVTRRVSGAILVFLTGGCGVSSDERRPGRFWKPIVLRISLVFVIDCDYLENINMFHI